MKKKYTYKQYLYLLIAVFVLGLLVSYKIAVKPTIDAKKKLQQLQDDIRNVDEAPRKRAMLLQQIEQYDRLIGEQATNQKFEQQQVLDYISNYCQKSKSTVREFPEIHSFTKENYVLNTIVFTIEGNFRHLLELLFLIETDLKIGSIQSIDFYTEDEFRTKKKRLFLKVYLQTINQLKS